jgi:hypothetical protein
MLEGFDLLRHSVLLDFYFFGSQVVDALAIESGVHIHADIIRAGSECRLVLRPQDDCHEHQERDEEVSRHE